jgi:hypothetical protein
MSKVNLYNQEEFEKIFPTIPYPGIECNSGWFFMIEILLSWADEWNKTVPEEQKIVVKQIKEKYGTLRFYFIGGNDKFRGMVEMAEILSGCICEICGNPGSKNVSGYITTQCISCRTKHNSGWGKTSGE